MGHSPSRISSLGGMWHVFAVQRKHQGHLYDDGRWRSTTAPRRSKFLWAETRYAHCRIAQPGLGLGPVGSSDLRPVLEQQGDGALLLQSAPGHNDPDTGRLPWALFPMDVMHGSWTNDRCRISGLCRVFLAWQRPPTEGRGSASRWLELRPNGVDRCRLSYCPENLSWTIREVGDLSRISGYGAPIDSWTSECRLAAAIRLRSRDATSRGTFPAHQSADLEHPSQLVPPPYVITSCWSRTGEVDALPKARQLDAEAHARPPMNPSGAPWRAGTCSLVQLRPASSVE